MDFGWSSLDTYNQVLWGIAIFSLVVFLIQVGITVFLGGDHDHSGADADMSGDVGDIGDSAESFDGENIAAQSDNLHMAEGHTDIAHDHGDGWGVFHYLTIRNLVAFLLGLSWGSLGLIDLGLGNVLATACGIATGLLMAFLTIQLMRLLAKAEASGTLTLRDAIGGVGAVTVEVPQKSESGAHGKVLVTFKEREREIEAVSSRGTLKRNTPVRVVGVKGNYIVVAPQ